MFAALRKISLTKWILVSMVVGVLVGQFLPETAVQLGPISSVFLRMIKSLVAPLLFSTLVVGIAGHGDDLKQVGKLAFRSIVYFEVVTTAALVVGLVAVNLVKPGVGVALDVPATAIPATAAKPTVAGLLEHIVPQSVVEAAAKNEVLPVVFWSIIFAIALTRVPAAPRKIMLGLCESLSEVMFKFVGIVMLFAPFGIGAALAVTIGTPVLKGDSAWTVIRHLGLLVLTLYAALIVFAVGVLLPVAILAKVPIRRFISAVKEPWLIAFSTASSEAALPRAMQAMEVLGVPKRIVAFVIPTGYSFNLDGSTLYLALASVFVAQAAGIHMALSQQLLMMLTLMITSKGVAAVPRASIVILAGALTQFGLPLEGVAVILGVDAFMDMARTSVNVVGNCLASVVMARWDGSFETPPNATDTVTLEA
jgi:proton glutamate symport protein